METKISRVLTPSDVAEITGRSLRLIYRELRKGNIRHAKAGDLYLITEDSLRRWLEGNPPPSAPTGSIGS